MALKPAPPYLTFGSFKWPVRRIPQAVGKPFTRQRDWESDRMPGRGLVGWVAFAVLLAGCAGSSAAPAPPGSLSVVQAGAGEGTLRGLVTDVEIVPLVGARVQIVNLEDVTAPTVDVRTNEGGRFEVTGLPLGEHIVYVSKLGYREPAPKTVAVGQEALELVYLLDRLAVQVPFHVSVRYVTSYPLMLCAIYPGNFICYRPYGQFPNQFYTHVIDEPQFGKLQSLVVEMKWTTPSALCQAGMRNDVFSPEAEAFTDWSASNPYHWDSLPKVTSPTHLFVARDGTDRAMHSDERTELNEGKRIQTNGNCVIVTNPRPPSDTAGIPAGMDCGYNQSFQNWVTTFYVEPATSEIWSAVADS